MSGSTGRSAPAGSRYADQRPYVVPDSLDGLTGPIGGVVVLDHRLDWSGGGRYDLDNPRRLARMYETVLREASTVAELNRWLDGPSLVQIWADLVLPEPVRRLWQERFPQLSLARRPAA